LSDPPPPEIISRTPMGFASHCLGTIDVEVYIFKLFELERRKLFLKVFNYLVMLCYNYSVFRHEINFESCAKRLQYT